MTRRLPPLNALRAFEAAARHMSFSRAAEELHITQAAISHQVKGLEEHLGMTLFRWLNRALMLTDEGQALFPAVRDSLDVLSAAVDSLKARDAGGPLTVSALPSFAAKWIVPRMMRFQERHPEIELRITAAEKLVDFARDNVDIAVRFGGGQWPGVALDHILDEDATPVCSPAIAAGLKDPADLAHHTLLHESMHPLLVPGWADWLNVAGVTGIDASKGPMFSHTHMMLQAAIDGQGVALGGRVLISDDLAAGRLVAPFDVWLPSGSAYYVAYPPPAADRPKIKAFRDWVMDEIAAVIGSG